MAIYPKLIMDALSKVRFSYALPCNWGKTAVHKQESAFFMQAIQDQANLHL